MALGVRGEIRSIIPHYAGQLGGFPTRGKEKVFAPYDFLSLKSLPHPKILELLMLYLPLSTVEGISSGIRGTLGGRRGGFPTGSEQQVPGASNLGYRPTRQTASYAPAPANKQTALALLLC